MGVLPRLGARVHFANPYAGQSKPIERAFRDLCEDGAKHPAFQGAYCGNRPANRPESCDPKNAVPLAEFEAVVADVIAEHNARPGRRGGVCAGRSFLEVFEASYAAGLSRRARAE